MQRTASLRCLTLIEPFASLIALSDRDPRKKRVENRQWTLTGRNRPTIDKPLAVLIHAGVGSTYGGVPVSQWGARFGIGNAEQRPGFALAVARFDAILPIEELRALPDDSPFAWAKRHMHTSGPFCWIVGDVAPLAEPFKLKGRQGLYRVEVEVDRLPGKARRWLGLEPARRLRSDVEPPAVEGLLHDTFLGLTHMVH